MYVVSAYQNRENTVLGISATEITLNHQAIFSSTVYLIVWGRIGDNEHGEYGDTIKFLSSY